jgi:hypothetical protein
MKLLPALLASLALVAGALAETKPASTVSTFHCLSVYWSPEGGAADKQVTIRFREKGQAAWRDGLPMKYNRVETPESLADYRGSIVHLKPGTAYEIELALQGTATKTTLAASTWSEKFPIASTVKVQPGNSLKVDQSGTPDGYVLYEGTNVTLDGRNQVDDGIVVNASYVILRGFTLKNVNRHGIHLQNAHHVVIENCDISQWGSEDEQGRGYGREMDSAIYSKNQKLSNIVIQRNKIHHPAWDSNSWAEDHLSTKPSRHPSGPQAISFWDCEGNNVIRYNECFSDKDHYFNDIIGGARNGSYRGFPGRDSDIYGNYIAHCWDDGIESEGANQNVRIWDNYIEETMIAIGNAATSIGPLYVWRNVSGRSHTPTGSSWDLTHGGFLKMGFANGEQWMTGHMYIFNNTILQPNDEGMDALGGPYKPIKHCTTRNNILHVRSKDPNVIATSKAHDNNCGNNNDFDYDLLSAKRYPAGHQKNGVHGVPRYVPGAGFDAEKRTGNFQLADGSPGLDQGVVIANFADEFKGKSPDIGAHEAGTPPMVFGTNAGR